MTTTTEKIRVRITRQIATASGTFKVGRIVAVERAVATDWIRCGYAVDAAEPEATAKLPAAARAKKAPETATRRSAKDGAR